MSAGHVPTYRCNGCGHAFVGQRLYCTTCTAATIERAKGRVPCICGRTRRPEGPCGFCGRDAARPYPHGDASTMSELLREWRWWWRMFWHARRARHVDHEAAFWWHTEVEWRVERMDDLLRPHSRVQCIDCGRRYKRWWRRVDHSACDELPF